MKSQTLWGIGIAGLMSVGLIAQTQDPAKSTSTSTDRKVTVKGCLEKSDATTAAAMNSFTLSQAEITKDEPFSGSNIAKDVARDTADVTTDAAKATKDAVTLGQSKDKDKKDIRLQVTPAADATIDLAAQVNHKVEIVGIMSQADVTAIKNKSAATASATMLPTFKARTVKSLSDKCN
jgi:hypothetical protein